MTPSNWTKSLADIAAMASPWFVDGKAIYGDDSARKLAEQFYTGSNMVYATRRIEAVLGPAIGRLQAERRAAIYRMAAELRAQGWRWLIDSTGIDAGLWAHESGVSVNKMGGFFRTFEEATLNTYNWRK